MAAASVGLRVERGIGRRAVVIRSGWLIVFVAPTSAPAPALERFLLQKSAPASW